MTATTAAADGCTHPGCGSHDTSTIDAVHGRRCTTHPPTFDPHHAVGLALRGAPGSALAACRVIFPGEPAVPFLEPYVRADIDRATAGLVQPLHYLGASDDFTVPAGFVTDFASVPQFLTWLVPKMGAWTRASIVHDWLCTELELGTWWRGDRTASPVSARDVDGIFRRLMREAGVPLVRRWLMWAAVRVGALTTPARRRGWWRDAPAVLGITAAALPIVLPATPLVLLGLALYWLAETTAKVVTR